MESDEVINQHAAILKAGPSSSRMTQGRCFRRSLLLKRLWTGSCNGMRDKLAEAPQVPPQPAPSLVQGFGMPQQQVDGIGHGIGGGGSDAVPGWDQRASTGWGVAGCGGRWPEFRQHGADLEKQLDQSWLGKLRCPQRFPVGLYQLPRTCLDHTRFFMLKVISANLTDAIGRCN